MLFFFCKQKTAYDMRISDWSSDVCSSDLLSTSPSAPLDTLWLIVLQVRATVSISRRNCGGMALAWRCCSIRKRVRVTDCIGGLLAQENMARGTHAMHGTANAVAAGKPSEKRQFITPL